MPEELLKLIINKMEKNRKDNEMENTITRIIRTQKAFLMISLDQNDNLSFQTIEFNHENSDSTFNIQEESSGTTRLLDLLSILLYSGENRTYVIDELDLRLHPDITVKFVKDFLDQATSKNIQLLITTHEYAIYDLSILRKDEIWMIDRSKGDSHIYSLNDYPEIRYDKKIIEAYEDNAFKARPILKETAQIFRALQEEQN